jgi:hypothetical protein
VERRDIGWERVPEPGIPEMAIRRRSFGGRVWNFAVGLLVIGLLQFLFTQELRSMR